MQKYVYDENYHTFDTDKLPKTGYQLKVAKFTGKRFQPLIV
ncbi:hypothetical protein FDUTEX481_01837 [Tolypothrix sp. PCC 7601]|nr:hypothetical protein FDUTEX481_01837 [Tolypothrix sp. PCC 7601]